MPPRLAGFLWCAGFLAKSVAILLAALAYVTAVAAKRAALYVVIAALMAVSPAWRERPHKLGR